MKVVQKGMVAIGLREGYWCGRKKEISWYVKMVLQKQKKKKSSNTDH